MSQPPNDPDPSAGRSGDQPAYGQPTYGQPSSGQPASGSSYGSPSTGQPTSPYGDPSQQQQQYGDQSQQHQQYAQQPGWSQPSPAQYGTDIRQTEAGYAQMYGQKPRTGMSVAALVLGILAIILAWFPVGSYIAVVLAILALIFGIIGVRRKAGKGMAVTGIVLGAISLVASVVMSVIWTFGFIAVSECIDETGGATAGPAFEACIERKATGF